MLVQFLSLDCLDFFVVLMFCYLKNTDGYQIYVITRSENFAVIFTIIRCQKKISKYCTFSMSLGWYPVCTSVQYPHNVVSSLTLLAPWGTNMHPLGVHKIQSAPLRVLLLWQAMGICTFFKLQIEQMNMVNSVQWLQYKSNVIHLDPLPHFRGETTQAFYIHCSWFY